MSLYLGDKPIANDGLQRLTGEIGDMGFAPLGIDESLNLRRYLNGQVISQIQFEAFTTKVKSAVALFPSLATTESNWQAEKALSKFGQVGKFVIDDENQTIRLPAVVNAQGLLDLTGIGGLVNESLPNIVSGSNTRIASDSAPYPIPTGASVIGVNNTEMYIIPTAKTSSTYDSLTVNALNASLSSTTYQDGAPVQQEAIQYPYYIQVATGIEEELPAIREYGINTPFFFGWSMYSENAPYNASLLASQGQYNSASVYPDLWTQLTGVELNSSLNVGDTIEISGKTYVKRGLPVVLSTSTITDYDFVVNQNDQTFRLPLLNGEEDLPLGEIIPQNIPTAENNYFDISYNCFVTIRMTDCGHCRLWDNTQDRENWTQTVDTGYQGKTLFMPKGHQLGVYYLNGTMTKFTFQKATGNGTLYYYVGDVVQDASLINAGAVLSDVVDLKQTTLRTDQITNCITEIPQDIQLELVDGTLTLKAGSKVYVPNGSGVFDVVTIASDLTHSFSGSAPRFAYYDSTNNELRSALASNANSGTTPSGTGLYYNTSTNNIDYLDNGTGRGYKASFPLCISNSDVSSIDQVFNGFGYIGSTVFALPNVKGLIPNGRNADGSLRNIEFTNDSVKTFTSSSSPNIHNTKMWLGTTGLGVSHLLVYNEKLNIVEASNGTREMFSLASMSLTSGVVSNFTPKLPFQAVDRNDSSWLSGLGMPSSRYIDLTLGARNTTYTAPANGWFVFGKRCSAVGQYFNVTYISPLYSPFWSDDCGAAVGAICGHLVPVTKGQIVRIDYSTDGATVVCRFIYAEGETDV